MQLRERARLFFAGLPMAGDGRQPFTDREEFLETSGDLYMAVRTTLKLMEAEMERMTAVDEAPGLKKRVGRLRTELEFLMESNSSNMVYWMERRLHGGGNSQDRSATRSIRNAARNTFIQATPIDVSELLHELVFEQIPTVVLTSATLTVQGGFEHMRKRLGLADARELVVPSHFKYGEQALLYLPPTCPIRASPIFLRPQRAVSGGFWNSPVVAPSASSPATARCATCMSVCSRCWTFHCCCMAPLRAKRSSRSSAQRQTPFSSAPPVSGREWMSKAKH